MSDFYMRYTPSVGEHKNEQKFLECAHNFAEVDNKISRVSLMKVHLPLERELFMFTH